MEPPISTEHEVDRLVQVYRAYSESEATQTKWSIDNRGNHAIQRERRNAIGQMLGAQGLLPLTGRSILEVGCGTGAVLMSLQEFGSLPQDLHGIDLLVDRIEIARQSYPNIDFQTANAEYLRFPDHSFDLILMFTVISSILDPRMAVNVAGELRRVLKPGGAVLWYDFRYDNPRNLHVRGITKADIKRLFPNFELRLRTITLVPQLARRLGLATRPLYPLLERIPLLRTHYLGLLVKR
jgi:ubiquinone/menaquinone biosynthesis C-methylase UbiE